MAKKKPEYDVTERFKRVAELASKPTGLGNVSNKEAETMSSASKKLAPDSTRPGASMNIPRNKYGQKKDVNLPFVKGPRK